MTKNPENQGLTSIPLPRIVSEAVTPVKRERDCVKHSVRKKNDDGSRHSKITSDNHAFYMGKFFPESIGGKIKRVLGIGKPEERIYNREFIEGGLEYLLQNIKKGEKAIIMVGRCVSELMNGNADAEGSLSAEAQIRLIKDIAQEKFDADDDRLEVINLEKEPRHVKLFASLRDSADKDTGIADLQKAFESDNGEVVQGSSLWIAQLLYKACDSSEELMEAFDDTVPGKLKEEEDRKPSSKYYGLIEVAIRLSDILNGKFIHGGSERQVFYDDIIVRLMQGKKGPFADIEELEPLFAMLKSCRFESLYLYDERNYYRQKKVQNTARYRLLVYGALAASAVAGIFGAGRLYERKETERRKKEEITQVRSKLKTTSFYMDGKFKVSEEYKVGIFKEVAEAAIKHLGARYELDKKTLSELEPFLKAFLLRNKGYLPTMYDNDFAIIKFVDLFVMENQIFFNGKGISVQTPYAKLKSRMPELTKLLTDEDIVLKDEIDATAYPGAQSVRDRLTPVGTFYSGTGISRFWQDDDRFEFYIYEKPGGKKVLVCGSNSTGERDSSMSVDDKKYVSTKRARLGIQQFMYAQKLFSLLPLFPFESELMLSKNPSDMQIRTCSKERDLDRAIHGDVYHAIEWTDISTGKRFDVIRYPGWDKKTNYSVDCLLAAGGDESKFSFESGQEVVNRYHEIQDRWIDYYHNRPEGDSGK